MRSHLFFKPFIGRDYSDGGIFKKRILIVGESHYCEDACEDCGKDKTSKCTRFTIDTVNDYLQFGDTDGWRNTFLKFERSLVGHTTTPEESRRIWQSVAFYNYVQRAMNAARQSPDDMDFKSSAPAFSEVLDALQPDLAIVWGRRLWERMSDRQWEPLPDKDIEGYTVESGNYVLDSGKRVLATYVYHPSTGYDWNFWHKIIRLFM